MRNNLSMAKLTSLKLVIIALFNGYADTWVDPSTGYTWTYTLDVNQAEIHGDSNFPYTPAVSPRPTGTVYIPSKLGGKPVTSVGINAFKYCDKLSDVIIPDSVRRIGMSAFEGCNCLTSVSLPNGVTSIENAAFYGCRNLKNVKIPNSVTNIGSNAFLLCNDSLFDIVTISNVKLVDGWAIGYTSALSNDLNLASVRGIGASAFQSCSGLTSVIIPDGITIIGEGAFANCRSLTSVTIPDSVVNVGDSTFIGCRGLADADGFVIIRNILYGSYSGLEIVIPDTVNTIANSAFLSRSDLLSVMIPGSVKKIGNSAFKNCTSLTNVSIDIGVAHIGTQAFYGCTTLANITLPESIVSIGDHAFGGCYNRRRLYLPRNYSGSTNGIQDVIIRYTPHQTVLLNANGGTVSPDLIVVDFNSSYGSLPVPERIGHVFHGWLLGEKDGYGGWGFGPEYVDEESIVVALDDHKLLAEWRAIPYSVTFDANGGTGGWSKVCDYGTAIVAPTVTRTGYDFTGWSPEVAATVPDNNVIYTAQWTPKKYQVVFDANGGVGGWSEVRDYDSALVAPAVSRVGYTFVGWSPAVPATVPANDATYTAQWRINTHSVTFDANGGTGGTSRKQDYGTAIVAPTVTRTGYTFNGWTPEVAATVPDGDVSYTAQWEANAYTVSFNSNGGDMNGGAASKGVVFDSAYGELPMPVLEFCSFEGWTLGGGVVTPSTKVEMAMDHTLVARWSRWGARVASDAAMTGRTLRELYPDDYANLTTVVIEEGIAELPDGFFAGCDNVENLTLPESLETLGYNELPKKIRESLDYGADGFMVYQGWVLGYGDAGASALSLPSGARGVGTGAFAEFWDLETVAIPDTVKRIGRNAFFECTFLDDVEIPDSVETIGVGAFENCSYMQTLSVGNGVRKVADRAFARCASLQAVSFADGLESVGACAFSNDWRMLSVSLPHSVTNIGDGAFADCRRVKGVAVPAGIMTLSEMFPAAYANIESVSVAVGETDIMDDMFNGCAALADFTWSGSETNVGERAFLGCEALASVAMPDGVVRIGAASFRECSSLRDITLSRSLAALPDFVFEGCGALDSFIVPASVTELGEGIVYESAVSAIYYLGNAPSYDANAYANAAAGLVTYVVRGTRGWDGTPSSRVLPEDWLGHEITYWTPNRFDVTFDANGGCFGESSVAQWAEQQITDMGYVLPDRNPVRPGYAFDGWWTEPAAGAQVKYSTQVTATKPHSLYAHWRLLGNLVTATFNANGGTVVIPGSQSYVSGQTFGEFPVPSRRGYAFCGWWTEAVGGDRMTEASRVPAADVELFAHWEPIRYFVAYDANGGTGVMTNQVHVYDVSKELDENLFSRTGYAFSGWAKSGDGQVEYANRAQVVNLAEISNAVVTLYAVWSGAGYNVRFDSNGGTGVMESQTIQIGETQNLHTNAFAFSGREFLGWATESGGIVAYRDGEAVSGLASANGATVHLYAVWRTSDATWRVSFDGNGGSVVPGHWNVVRGESLDALPTPTRPGHAFMGWWTRSAGGTSVATPFAVAGDMSLYAHWRAYDDPLPPVSGDAGVAAVMGDSADLRLAENVKTVGEYDALVEWADANGIGHQSVRTSLHVWSSYALGARTLLKNEPEIEIGEVEVGEGSVLVTAHPALTVSVTVKDGGKAVAVDAAKIASMFEATSDLGDWYGAARLYPKVEVLDDLGSTGDPEIRFTVTLNAIPAQAFLRIRK